MHEQSDIKVTKIDRHVRRPGFTGRFHCVTFEWVADRLVHASFTVWVSSAYPEAEAERVARTLLSPRLRVWPNWPPLLRFASQKTLRRERGATGAGVWGCRSAGVSRRRSASRVT